MDAMKVFGVFKKKTAILYVQHTVALVKIVCVFICQHSAFRLDKTKNIN